MPKDCDHPNFNFTAKLLEVGFAGTDQRYPMMEVTAQCRECGEDYVFLDMEADDAPAGQIRYQPHTSGDGKRVYLPCALASHVQINKEVLN
jgi:hypothetical protein